MNFYREWFDNMHGSVARQDSIFKISFAAMIVLVILAIISVIGIIMVKSPLFIVMLIVAIVFIAGIHGLIMYCNNHYYD